MMKFNLLETHMSYLLMDLMGKPFHVEIYGHTKKRNFDDRIELFEKEAKRRCRDRRTQIRINGLAESLRTTNTRRNDLVHGQWRSLGVPACIGRFSPPGSWTLLRVTPDEIFKDAQNTLNLTVSLRRFHIMFQKKIGIL